MRIMQLFVHSPLGHSACGDDDIQHAKAVKDAVETARELQTDSPALSRFYKKHAAEALVQKDEFQEECAARKLDLATLPGAGRANRAKERAAAQKRKRVDGRVEQRAHELPSPNPHKKRRLREQLLVLIDKFETYAAQLLEETERARAGHNQTMDIERTMHDCMVMFSRCADEPSTTPQLWLCGTDGVPYRQTNTSEGVMRAYGTLRSVRGEAPGVLCVLLSCVLVNLTRSPRHSGQPQWWLVWVHTPS